MPPIYDELFRRHLALRAQRADPTLDILKESSEPSKEIMALASTRLETVLTAVGVDHQMASSRPTTVSGDVGLTSQLQAQEQATLALLKRSQEATRALASQAEALRHRESAMQASSPSPRRCRPSLLSTTAGNPRKGAWVEKVARRASSVRRSNTSTAGS